MILVKSKVIGDILGYIPYTILPPIISLLGIICFSRALGPTLFGEYILVLITIQSTTMITMGWISHYVFRFHHEKLLSTAQDAQIQYKSTTFINLLFSILISVIIIIFALVIMNVSPLFQWIGISIIAIISNGIFEILKSIRRSKKEIKGLNIISLFVTSISVGTACIYLVIYNSSPLGLLTIQFVSKLVILSIFIPWELLWLIITNNINISWVMAKEFFLYGFPLTIATIGHIIMSVSNRYFIEYYNNASFVGFYSAAYELYFKIFTLGFPFIIAAAMPHIIKYYDTKQSKEAFKLYDKAYFLLFILITPIVGFSFMHGKELLILVFGEAYSTIGAHVIQLIIISAYFWIVTTFNYRLLMLVKMTKFNALSSIVCALFCLIGNAILISKYGLFGAAISMASSYMLLALITQIIVKRHIKYVTYSILKPVIFLFIGIISAWSATKVGGYLSLEIINNQVTPTALLSLFGLLILTCIISQFFILCYPRARKHELLFLRKIITIFN